MSGERQRGEAGARAMHGQGFLCALSPSPCPVLFLKLCTQLAQSSIFPPSRSSLRRFCSRSRASILGFNIWRVEGARGCLIN